MTEGQNGFDEAKYKALLEGLEISEIDKSHLERTLRVDAEFYSKENLRVLDILSKLPLNCITDLVKVSDGNHMSISDNFCETGVPYYRGQDIHSYFIEESIPICIDINTFNEPVMKRSHLKEGDVLLSIVGTIGGVSLVSSNSNATCSCKLAIFRPLKADGYFLSAFLKSKYGQNQIKKFTRGAVQMGLILEDMNQILVPEFSILFQGTIRNCIELAKEKSKLSKQIYSSAETLLLKTLGLSNFEPSKESVNVKSFKESFLATGRLDAEYYQKKYEEIKAQIYCTAKEKQFELVSLKKISSNPKYGSSEKLEYIDFGVPFLRIADLEDKTFNSKNLKYISSESAKKEASAKVKTNDILISRSGTLGLSVLIPKELEDAIYGSYFIKITPDTKKINPKYLTFYLNSKIGQLQVEQENTGGIQTNLTIPVIESIYVVIPDDESQRKIIALIEESFHLKKQSEQLLETAKRAVETAIEQDEEAAMRYIVAAV